MYDVRSDVANVRLFLKLFDSLVQPVLLYGCEIWGPHCLNSNNRVLTFVNKFYKTLIGVKQRCSNVGVLCELGRYPIEINIAKAMIKFWFRLISLPTNRLTAHCYWALFNQNNLHDSWFDAIKTIINTTGQFHVWNDQVNLVSLQKNIFYRTQNYIIQAVKDVFSQFSYEKMNSESKLSLYKNNANNQKLSSYLIHMHGRNRRRNFANLRLGTFDIELEKGRHSGVERESRYCKICFTRKLENEEHHLFVCPSFASIRTPFIEKIEAKHKNFRAMSPIGKINFLYFNENLDTDTQCIAADLLLSLREHRKYLIELQNLLVKRNEAKNLKNRKWSANCAKIEKVLIKNLQILQKSG